MQNIAVVYYSGYGHTKLVAEKVAQGAHADLISIDNEGNITEQEWEKLDAADASPEVKERIIRRLEEEKFIDETRFCRSFVNDKLRFNKWGRIKIDFELRNRGISPALREESLGSIDEQYYNELLAELLTNKKKSIKAKDARDAYLKLLRFGAGRGFESNLISRCLQQLVKGGDDETME